MTEAVKVAVRVRPFNQREIDRGAKLIIGMEGNLTQITDPDNTSQPPKDFTFDYSYWSHDGFHVDDEGVCVADAPKYHSQRKVFEDLGQGVLDNAVKGFNCSLFAYGQTGSGKSYSMVGYGANKGIVPITCDELFKIIESSKTDTKYQVTFSMLEIYNEQVRDLLTKENPKGGLAVRQNPKLGAFYVQGLKFVAVGSYKEIDQRTQEGTANRTVAQTQMNATSSRAHTVVTIQFDQIVKNEAGAETKKSSVINLVDLAGSERAESTGATGDRLKEGANINKSLSALGNVISALAEQSNPQPGKPAIVIPYRDSVLTKLLKNALGGNSKTIMIAALSPADINYAETLSTLRYADRAKKIKNKAVVNENPMEKLIRELKEENEKLKKGLAGDLSAFDQSMSGHAAMSEEDKAKMRKEIEDELRAKMAANHALMNWDELLETSRQETTSRSTQAQQDSLPHLVNLNEDPMLSGVVKHYLNGAETTIGRKDTTIKMPGLSIADEHAIITIHKDHRVTIRPATLDARTKVNGDHIKSEVDLKHHDRMVFGSNHFYYFVNQPQPGKHVEPGTPDTVTWDLATKEIAESKGFVMGKGLSKEQAWAQEEILALLPKVSEANAISEEMDKKKFFEVIVVSKIGEDGVVGVSGDEIKVLVRMIDLRNDNEWVWEHGKFMNRCFLMHDLYQRMADGEDISKLKKEEDPFWEPLEDVTVGRTIVYLQSLSFGLDVDDHFPICNDKGEEEGRININITPCSSKGVSLEESDVFIEDPDELLGKPYHFQIQVKQAEITNPRYQHGVYLTYKSYGDRGSVQTSTVSSLNPKFNYSRLVSIEKVEKQHLEWFESGVLSFQVFAAQKDHIPDKKRLKMSTKSLRSRREKYQRRQSVSRARANSFQQLSAESHLRSELILYKRRYARSLQKERRLKDLLDEWSKKKDKDFQGFYRAVHAAVHHQHGMLKYKVNLLHTGMKNNKGDGGARGGEGTSEDVRVIKSVTGCDVM